MRLLLYLDIVFYFLLRQELPMIQTTMATPNMKAEATNSLYANDVIVQVHLLFNVHDQLRLTVFISDSIADYYVIFNGEHAGIYRSWPECSKYILGEKGIVHKKFNSYERAVRALQEYMEPNPSAPEAPFATPFNSVPSDPIHPVKRHDGNAGDDGWWKMVFFTSIVVLLIAFWLQRG